MKGLNARPCALGHMKTVITKKPKDATFTSSTKNILWC